MSKLDMLETGSLSICDAGVNLIASYDPRMRQFGKLFQGHQLVNVFRNSASFLPFCADCFRLHPMALRYCSSLRRSGNNLRKENPRTDCTPPSYTKLLCTNLCGSTPAAVSDDLIKLYTSRVEK
ncbi:hypothetical protein M514_02947 [Trichuris suis]|uniref:Uncharacterized protein n=1 Tax=Trichuris suis TaxID=68888 RepID=A0A085NB50_9BILA|nr:hypothetical protein M513_02947 [Trichuris suis]KFD66696.1 hypothetical protein M514_02947 [Trichuris suis]